MYYRANKDWKSIRGNLIITKNKCYNVFNNGFYGNKGWVNNFNVWTDVLDLSIIIPQSYYKLKDIMK